LPNSINSELIPGTQYLIISTWTDLDAVWVSDHVSAVSGRDRWQSPNVQETSHFQAADRRAQTLPIFPLFVNDLVLCSQNCVIRGVGGQRRAFGRVGDIVAVNVDQVAGSVTAAENVIATCGRGFTFFIFALPFGSRLNESAASSCGFTSQQIRQKPYKLAYLPELCIFFRPQF
jgi:hypothetical protein